MGLRGAPCCPQAKIQYFQSFPCPDPHTPPAPLNSTSPGLHTCSSLCLQQLSSLCECPQLWKLSSPSPPAKLAALHMAPTILEWTILVLFAPFQQMSSLPIHLDSTGSIILVICNPAPSFKSVGPEMDTWSSKANEILPWNFWTWKGERWMNLKLVGWSHEMKCPKASDIIFSVTWRKLVWVREKRDTNEQREGGEQRFLGS